MSRRISMATLLVLFAVEGCSGDETQAPSSRGASNGPTSDAGAQEPSSPDGGATDGGGAAVAPEQSGEATYYDAEGTGACGIGTSADYLVAAINDEQYSKANCGRCVLVKGPKGTVTVRIIDKCPGCDFGDLDLSETAFTKIADKSAGRVKITWQFVPCP